MDCNVLSPYQKAVTSRHFGYFFTSSSEMVYATRAISFSLSYMCFVGLKVMGIHCTCHKHVRADFSNLTNLTSKSYQLSYVHGMLAWQRMIATFIASNTCVVLWHTHVTSNLLPASSLCMQLEWHLSTHTHGDACVCVIWIYSIGDAMKQACKQHMHLHVSLQNIP